MTAFPEIDHGFSNAVDRLENLVSRLTRADAILRLEQESEKHWVVVDVANPVSVLPEREGDSRSDVATVDQDTGERATANPISRSESAYQPAVMRRGTRTECLHFIVAFKVRHPETRLDTASLSSGGLAGESAAVLPAVGPSGLNPPENNVVPIRAEIA